MRVSYQFGFCGQCLIFGVVLGYSWPVQIGIAFKQGLDRGGLLCLAVEEHAWQKAIFVYLPAPRWCVLLSMHMKEENV